MAAREEDGGAGGATGQAAPAATGGGEAGGRLKEDSLDMESFNVERKSLLDVVMDKAEQLELMEKLQRVLVGVRYSGNIDAGEAIKEQIDDCVKKTVAQDEQGGFTTGLTILLNACCLLTLEGPQRLIVGTLRSLQDAESGVKGQGLSFHMFLSIQDTPGRMFPMYSSCSINQPKADPAHLDRDGVINLIPEMSINLQKIGKNLKTLDEKDYQEAMSNMQRKYPEFIPSVKEILGLCASPDVMSLEEYFDLYYTPTRCLGSPLDSEVVWPMPPNLVY